GRDLLPLLEDSTNAALHFSYQDFMKKSGRLREAQRQYKKWLSDRPKDAALAAFYSRLIQNPIQKKEWLEKAAAIDPQNEAVLLVQAEQRLYLGKTASAQKALTGVESNQWPRWLLEARIAARKGDIQQAKSAYQKTLQDGIAPLSAAIDYARFLTSSTDVSQGPIPNPFARWSEEELLDEPEAYSYYVWLSQKPFQEAVENVPQEVFYDPKALSILCRPVLLSMVRLDSSKPSAAQQKAPIDEQQLERVERLMNQASRIDPYIPSVLINKGLLILSKDDAAPDDIREAEPFFSAGLGRYKSYATKPFHIKMGAELLQIGQYELAAAHYKKAWGYIPEDGKFLKMLAELRVQEKDYEQALALLEQLRELTPRDKEVHRRMAELYLKINEIDKARKSYGEVIVIDEQDKEARAMIADIWMKKENPTRALQVYQALLRRDPENGHCHAQIARIFLKIGRLAQADSYLKQVQKDHPNARDMDDVLSAVNEVELAKKNPAADHSSN
ncbi:MAG: tetratricopeptide repeat protein, partial [Candidatus Hinthialibacter sp.]